MPTARVAVLHVRTGRPYDPTFQASLDRLNDGARAAVSRLGWDAHLLASAEHPVSASLAAVRRADAVVLMGGEDVHPSFYGGQPEYCGGGRHEPRADEAHIAAAHEAIRLGTPLLGLCRGHQILNVALAGSLVQDLGRAGHRRAAADPFVETLVRLEDAGDLHTDVDVTQPARCSHHQAIEHLGTGLRVAARAGDGVIEAVVHESAPVTGVQWHPEHPDVTITQLAGLLRRLERQMRG